MMAPSRPGGGPLAGRRRQGRPNLCIDRHGSLVLSIDHRSSASPSRAAAASCSQPEVPAR